MGESGMRRAGGALRRGLAAGLGTANVSVREEAAVGVRAGVGEGSAADPGRPGIGPWPTLAPAGLIGAAVSAAAATTASPAGRRGVGIYEGKRRASWVQEKADL